MQGNHLVLTMAVLGYVTAPTSAGKYKAANHVEIWLSTCHNQMTDLGA